MVGVFLLSTIGFTVYESYCHCLDKTTESFFKEVGDDCHHNTAHTTSCCEEQATTPTCHINANQCHDTEMAYIKLNTSYIGQTIEKITPSIVTIFVVKALVLPDKSWNSLVVIHQIEQTIPPPRYGKTLLFFTHQLKIGAPVQA